VEPGPEAAAWLAASVVAALGSSVAFAACINYAFGHKTYFRGDGMPTCAAPPLRASPEASRGRRKVSLEACSTAFLCHNHHARYQCVTRRFERRGSGSGHSGEVLEWACVGARRGGGGGPPPPPPPAPPAGGGGSPPRTPPTARRLRRRGHPREWANSNP
jgi:hypothetical protein